MLEGKWKVNLYKKGQLIISTSFKVDKRAELKIDLFKKKKGIQYVSIGSSTSDGDFKQLSTIHPNENMKIQLLIKSNQS